MTDFDIGFRGLTREQLVVLLRAVTERVANADGEEREVLRWLGMAIQQKIVGGPPPLPLPAPPPRPTAQPRVLPTWSPKAIRTWAWANGIPVSGRGHLPARVTRMYGEALRQQGEATE